MGLLALFQEKLIFLPSKLDQDYVYSFQTPFTELNLATPDGAQLNALHFKPKNPQGIIVYFHGNAGDLSRWGYIAEPFTKYGWEVLIMDYRSYGKSTGELSEKALYADAQLFYNFAKKQFNEDQIIVYGRSLGCAMATNVAANNKPNQLILETPFFSMEDMANRRFPFLPTKTLLAYQFNNNKAILKVECPITIFQGTEDSVVPFESAEKLFQLIKDKKNRFVTIEGGEHNNLVEFQEYHETIDRLLTVKNVGREVTIPPVTDN